MRNLSRADSYPRLQLSAGCYQYKWIEIKVVMCSWEVHDSVCILMPGCSSLLVLNLDNFSARNLLSMLMPSGISCWACSPTAPFLPQSSSMPANSKEPTGLPSTPGNPGMPWRRWKTEEGGGTGGWGDSDGTGGGGTTHKRKWKEIRHIWERHDKRREEDSVCEPQSCNRSLSKELHSLSPRRGKRAPSA